jgi:hypothetical protein
MPIPVRVYTWTPGGALPINELHWTMFDLPPVGSRYWHGTDAFRVREVDETTDPPIVLLEHDAAWEQELRGLLPKGYWLDGGRDSKDGRWHFESVREGVGRPREWSFGETLDEAMSDVIAEVRHHAAQDE